MLGSKKQFANQNSKTVHQKIHILGGVGKVKTAKRVFEKIISVAGRGNKVKSNRQPYKNRISIYIWLYCPTQILIMVDL